ncbi:MAG: hypothetical protein KKG00_05325 [Bacteroidetes bacterium]|nr:hypothetical protein [Gammaproteobacteria bacterium]MBU1820920.1 hypothetical protein [Bacteroidota bacterium]
MPEWLPDIICLEDHDNDPEKYLGHLFSIYEKDFVNGTSLTFGGNRVLTATNIIDGKPSTFIHVTTEEQGAATRTVDLRRCERMCWIRPIIENSDLDDILIWENTRGSGKKLKKNVILFFEKGDFVIILLELKNVYYIVSAYHVRPHTKEKLLREYATNKQG